jgi:hypothetical protein
MDCPGFESREKRFSAPVQTYPGAHPAIVKCVPILSPGDKAAGVCRRPFTSHPAPRFKKEQSYSSPPSLGVLDLFWGLIYLYLYLSLLTYCFEHFYTTKKL